MKLNLNDTLAKLASKYNYFNDVVIPTRHDMITKSNQVIEKYLQSHQ